ncbi:sel1 repeat family protein [Microvirga sp. SRT01]|uniref:Sel1 repeat family protein n=1 Tax=Sphingomonas longa TaxID=2778730 RepID=A0ABS2D7W7_9SPHN|nr:sel1 repeat family protein [Sphingomonas sp. BT552]MBR7710072.1 sel1 repeat family protein [Microvirga sp. SRT01]
MTTPACPDFGVAALQCRAERGDKIAQLELGKAYEFGSDLEQNYTRAADLYRRAGAQVSGTTYVYSPPVGQSRGQVVAVRIGPDQTGLAEAKYRLGMLYRLGRGVEENHDRAAELINTALIEGYVVR